jgi:hypothetical protein
VQILVYPIYLLFQSARFAGKQLQQFWQSLAHPQPGLQPLAADTPIQKVLETVKSLALPAPSQTTLLESRRESTVKSGILTVENPISVTQEIQGIATLPESRNLVLINLQNQTLDILTKQQQQQLEKQISLELAEYWYHKLLVQDALRPATYLPPPGSSENALPPIRLLQKAMAWMQRGKVAGAINLFQEETLQLHQEVHNRELLYRRQQLRQKTQELKERQQELTLRSQSQLGLESTEAPEVNHTSLLTKVDRAIAIIEAGSLAIATNTPSYLIHHSQEFRQLVNARMQELTDEETHYYTGWKLKFQVLIKAAVEYFFTTKPTVELTSPEDLSNLKPTDPGFWLTEKDLFPEPLASQNQTSNFSVRSQGKPTTVNHIETTVFTPNAASKATTTTPQNPQIAIKNKLENPLNSNKNYTTDYLETQATPTGYIKHPLEQVLEILDRIMFFIEELLITIWQEMRQFFR